MSSSVKFPRVIRAIALMICRHPTSYSHYLKNMMKLASVFIILSLPIMLEINSWIGGLFLVGGIFLAAHIASLRKAEREGMMTPEYKNQIRAYLSGESDVLPQSPIETRSRKL